MTAELLEHDTSVAADPDGVGTVSDRRWFLRAAGVGLAAAGATTVLGVGSAEAVSTRTVYKYVPLAYRYDARRRLTTVTQYRRVKVTARIFSATRVYTRLRGRWVRIPYRYNSRRRILTYDHYLHLLLTPRARPTTKPRPKPAPTPKPGSVLRVAAVAAPATGAASYVDTSMVWHLARRASYGPTPKLVAEIAKLGPSAWLERQLHPTTIPDPVSNAYLARFGSANTRVMPLGSEVNQVKYALDNNDIDRYQQSLAVGRAHIARALWSERHLLTVMEDFWGNHFNISAAHDNVVPHREHFQAVIRYRALGRFADLLNACLLHPGMLTYLNNRESDARHPNENLGRELLELHTLGVDTPYTETDVVNSARILTGLTVSPDNEMFHYRSELHWTGEIPGAAKGPSTVRVYGFTHPNTTQSGGYAVALSYLNYLAHHVQTARYVCRKLATRFVSDAPSTALVEAMAATYLGNDTAIAPVLRTMFSSTEFARSAGAKSYRPAERMFAGLRNIGIVPDVLDPLKPQDDRFRIVGDLWYKANDSGNAPFTWDTPDGYKDVTVAWMSTAATLTSWNNRINSSGWVQDSQLRTNLLPAVFPLNQPAVIPANWTHGLMVQAVAKRLFGRTLSTEHLAAALTFLGVNAADPVSANSNVVQDRGYRIRRLALLLLDSPHGLHR